MNKDALVVDWINSIYHMNISYEQFDNSDKSTKEDWYRRCDLFQVNTSMVAKDSVLVDWFNSTQNAPYMSYGDFMGLSDENKVYWRSRYELRLHSEHGMKLYKGDEIRNAETGFYWVRINGIDNEPEVINVYRDGDFSVCLILSEFSSATFYTDGRKAGRDYSQFAIYGPLEIPNEIRP